MEKTSELIFSIESKKYDTRKVLNRAESFKFTDEFIASLKADGLTIEQIDALKVPVFKYTTQITVHGVFDTDSFRLGGYKSAIVNGNGSLGLKYCAIDTAKKIRLREVCRTVKSQWTFFADSLHFGIYVVLPYSEQGLIDAKKLIATIDENTFYGHKHLYRMRSLYGDFIEAKVFINGFYDTDFWAMVAMITGGKTEADYTEQVKANEIQAKIDEQRYQEQRAKEKAEAQILHEQQTEKLKIYPLWNRLFSEGIVIARPKENRFRVFKITFERGWYKLAWRDEDTINVPNFESYTASKKSVRSWGEVERFFKNDYYVISQPTPDKPKAETATPVVSGDVKVIQYSEKCIAVYGDTRPIKDTLKSIGARFNPFLTIDGIKQAGWVLPLSQRDKLNLI